MHEFHLDRRMIDVFDVIAQRFQAKGVTLPAILATCGVVMFTCFGQLALSGLLTSDGAEFPWTALAVTVGASGLGALCAGIKDHFRDALREFGTAEMKSYRSAAQRERAFETGSRVIALILSAAMVFGGLYIVLADSLRGAPVDVNGVLFSGGFLGYAAWRYFRCAFPIVPPEKKDERSPAFSSNV